MCSKRRKKEPKRSYQALKMNLYSMLLLAEIQFKSVFVVSASTHFSFYVSFSFAFVCDEAKIKLWLCILYVFVYECNIIAAWFILQPQIIFIYKRKDTKQKKITKFIYSFSL